MIIRNKVEKAEENYYNTKTLSHKDECLSNVYSKT